jgi:hypothetical protein
LIKEQDELSKKASDTLKKQASEREDINDRLLVATGKLTQAEADWMIGEIRQPSTTFDTLFETE